MVAQQLFQRNRKRRIGQRNNNAVVVLTKVLVLIAVVSWASVIIAWTQSTLNYRPTKAVVSVLPQQQQQQQQHPKTQEQKTVERSGLTTISAREEIDLFPDDLQHPAFTQTLKSCLPATDDGKNKCKLFVPNNHVERIAVMSPPGALGSVFEQFIDEVVRLHTTTTATATKSFELIKTSHVPPYGYGKTHGYTKIIRLASLPLRLAAADLVLFEEETGSSGGAADGDDTITVADLVQAVSQLVRWHCRLSHVAAHTALMTITLEDLLEDPWEEEFQVRTFLNLKEDHHSLEDHMQQEQHIDEDELAGSMDEIVHRSVLLMQRLGRRNPTVNLEQLLDRVVNEELSRTKNLEAWPCHSFWALGDEDGAVTEISKRTARLFSPNCTASKYTSCFVPRDFCEEKGDAKCAKQK